MISLVDLHCITASSGRKKLLTRSLMEALVRVEALKEAMVLDES
jgi:hypothetical protein